MKYIYVVLSLYVADAVISLAFLSTMVAFLQRTGGGGPFNVDYRGDTFKMHGEPLNLLTNHGHVTNGAGGTAVVLIGLGGVIALILEHQSRKKVSASGRLPWCRTAAGTNYVRSMASHRAPSLPGSSWSSSVGFSF